METLKYKKVLLLGATGGIGVHLVQLLTNSGAVVCVAGRNAEKLSALAAKYNLPNEQVFQVDLANQVSVKEFAMSLSSLEAPFDIFINAAGIGLIKPFDQLESADMQNSFQVNVMSTFDVLKAILPKMVEVKKGLVINIPGILGKIPMSGAAAYCASKYALVGMMQSIREELKRTEIRITQVYLGGVDSPFWDNINLRVQREKMIQAEEAAKSIWFLCQQPVSGVVSEMVIQPFNHQAI
ncbi:MAG: SDR family oxidoreductase [Sediminibacterium sp.]